MLAHHLSTALLVSALVSASASAQQVADIDFESVGRAWPLVADLRNVEEQLRMDRIQEIPHVRGSAPTRWQPTTTSFAAVGEPPVALVSNELR